MLVSAQAARDETPKFDRSTHGPAHAGEAGDTQIDCDIQGGEQGRGIRCRESKGGRMQHARDLRQGVVPEFMGVTLDEKAPSS